MARDPMSQAKFTFFDELRMATKTPTFQLKSIYGPDPDPIRDITVGTVTVADGEYQLQNAGNGDITILDTAERCPYAPGLAAEIGAGMRGSGRPTGNTNIDFGVFGDTDGWFFRIAPDGLYRVVERDSTEDASKIGYWSGTTIVTDGFDSTDLFDINDGTIFQIIYSWYAYGPAEWEFQSTRQDSDTKKWMQLAGSYVPSGQTSVTDPQQPLRIRVTTGAGDPAYTVYVGGRQHSIIGDYNPIGRTTTVKHTVTGVDDVTWVPVMTVKRKSVTPYALTRLRDTFVRSSADIVVGVETNSVLTSPTYNDIEFFENTSLLEAVLGPTATFDDGQILQIQPTNGGVPSNPGGGAPATEQVPVIEDQPFTIYVKKFDGDTGTVAVDVFATFIEER